MRKVKTAPYKPHKTDHPALKRRCPACGAKVGFWCSGGIGDVHEERMTKPELAALRAKMKADQEAFDD